MVQRLSDLIQLGAGDGLTLASAQATSFPAGANTVYPVAAGVTVTLDASMAAGSWVVLLRGEADWASSAVVVNGGGQAFDGTQANLELQGQAIGAAFHRSATGWDAYVHESAQSYFEALSASFGLDFSTATSVLRATYKPSAEALALVMAVEAAGAKRVFKPGSAPMPIDMASSAPATRMSYKASADPIGIVLGFPAIISGFTYTQADAEAFDDACTNEGWDAALRADIDQLVADLKSGQLHSENVWALEDRILLLDLPNASDSYRYLNAPTLTATAVNSPTHVANQGATGGGTKRIDTNYNPSSHGANYTLNSANIDVWIRTASSSVNMAYCGRQDGANATLMFGNSIYFNTSASGSTSVSPAYAAGLAGMNRTSSSEQAVFKDGVSSSIGSVNSAALVNASIILLGFMSGGSFYNGSDAEISIWTAGAGKTANQAADKYDALNRYRTAREAA